MSLFYYMRISSPLIILFAFLVASAGAVTTTESGSAAKCGHPAGGVELCIKAKSNIVRVGHPVLVWGVIRNLTNRPIPIVITTDPNDMFYPVMVIGPSGAPMPLTHWGASLIRRLHGGSIITGELRPHESMLYNKDNPYPVSRTFEMKALGKYRIIFHWGGNADCRSNTIVVTIKK